jgi:hypothetical protein
VETHITDILAILDLDSLISRLRSQTLEAQQPGAVRVLLPLYAPSL